MIKPFEIVSTRPDPGGTGVLFRVRRRYVSQHHDTVRTLEGYLLVPEGQDVDRATFEHLKASGWID